MKNGVWTSIVPFKVVKLSGTALAALLLAVAPTALEARKSAGNGAYSQNDLFQLSADGKTLVKYRGNASEVIIPDGITEIGTGAFRHKRNLTKVVIPDSVTEIGNWAFANNSNLFQITVPASVKEIGPGAFAGVRAVEVSRDNENFYIDDRGALIDRQTKTLIYCPPSVRRYTVSNDVTSISAGAFFYCINLTGVTIHAKVSRIESAFIGCPKLTEINVAAGHPEYYTDDAGALLSGKRNLILFCPPSVKEYTVPDNINAISLDAFKNCYKLTGVTIPDSVKKIPFGAFSRCRKLKTAVIGSNTKLAKHAFPKNCKVIRREPGQRQTAKPETKPDNSTEQRINFQPVQSDPHNDFQLSDDGKTLVKYRGNASEVIIPDGITKIGTGAFRHKRNLTKVVIPDSVTEIGDSAFSACINLKEINLPANLERINYRVFGDNPNLTRIVIPESVTEIGPYAFYACKNLTEINIPYGVKKIDYNAFCGCSNLKKVTIPDSMTSIGNMAFEGCSNLKKVTIPDSVTSIGVAAFGGCKNVDQIFIPDSVKELGRAALYGIGSVKISSSNPNFYIDDNGALIDRKKKALLYYPPSIKVKTFTIPEYITNFDSVVFFPELKEVILHAKVSTFKRGGNTVIGAVRVSPDNPKYYTDDAGALFDRDRNALIYCPPSLEKYTIPDGIKVIEQRAFQWCVHLKEITIPDSVTVIESTAFANCRNLKEITIPDGVDSISYNVFYGCKSLTRISIGKDTKFKGMRYRNKVIRREPGQWQTVKPETKTETVKPETKTDNSTEQRINFQSVQSDPHKDFQLSADGKTLLKYRGNASEVIIPDGITKIADRAFLNNPHLILAVIPYSVTEIGSGAFAGCINLKQTAIPYSVTEIGRSAFSRCRNLRQITIPSGVTGIRMSTFEGCKNLSSIQIPSSVTMIESFAFQACHNLEKIIIPNGITRIGSGAFTGVQSVQISQKNQFYYTDKSGALIDRKKRMLIYCPPLLKKYKIPKNVTRIEVNAFSFFKNAKLEELIIPPHVNYIEGALGYVKSVKILPGNRNYYTDSHGVVFDKKGETLIYAPPALENYTVPNTVKWIRDMSFYWCENLSSITIPDNVKTIGVFAFPRTCKVIRR